MRISKKQDQIQVTTGKSRKSARRTPTKAGTLKIGTVSKKSGIPVVTLRFYEQMGLITSVQNAETRLSTHRRFAPAILIHLDFIKLCRASGISIPQIRSLMKLYRGFKVPSSVKMSALKRSIDLVRDQRSRLGQIEKVLLFRLRNPEGDIEDLLDD
ncbi:MAG: MerR family DNA-binding transcriptional regulator [Bdellovibrionales bacterium]|nr:MerR family DNA-binding transcriptional regulator [Bdellovibrionales bacterium]